ncbi:MAG: hypothetical protein ACE5GG_00350 [Candidatus Omnitrophota bacterium]
MIYLNHKHASSKVSLWKCSRWAQSTLEYAMVIAVVVGALVAMQIYMKRGVEGKLRSSADDIGQQFDAAATDYTYTTTRTSTTQDVTTTGVTTSHMGDAEGGVAETVTRTGSENVAAW